jgi:hypothetical protein
MIIAVVLDLLALSFSIGSVYLYGILASVLFLVVVAFIHLLPDDEGG